MTKDEALKLALEAIEGVLDDSPKVLEASITGGLYEVVQCRDAITAIKEVLAQPEQEPKSTIRALTEQCAALVWERDKFKKQVQQYEKNGVTCQTYRHKVEQSCDECNVNESYTTPPKRQPLTDDQFLELILRKGTQELVGVSTFVGGSIQMQGRIGLLHSAKIIKEFVEAAHNIKENT